MNDLRKKVLSRRKKISTEEKIKTSEKLHQQFLSQLGDLSLFKNILVASYRSIHNEILMENLEDYLSDSSVQFCYPKVSSTNNALMEMRKASYQNTSHWEQGAYDILEPLASCELVAPENLDIIFVPGVAYTSKRERIGLGKGYYDSYLARAKKALTVSFAYDFQMVEHLEQNSWDQKIDWLLTPKTEYLSDYTKDKIKNLRKTQ